MNRLLYAIVEQSMIQNNAINSLMGRLIEQREMTNMILEKRDNAFTYVDVSTKQERKRSLSRKREENCCSINLSKYRN